MADCSSASSQSCKQEVGQGFILFPGPIMTRMQDLLPKHRKPATTFPPLLNPSWTPVQRQASPVIFERGRWRLALVHYKSPAITAELSPFPECVSLHFRTGGWKAERTPDSEGGPGTARPPYLPSKFPALFFFLRDTRIQTLLWPPAGTHTLPVCTNSTKTTVQRHSGRHRSSGLHVAFNNSSFHRSHEASSFLTH